MYVIFGATGHAGRTTIAALRRARQPVRAVVRDARQAERLAAAGLDGCEIAVADLRDRASVAAAIRGAHAVQLLCPLAPGDADPAASMRAMIDISADALRADPPATLLAISDYGAELAQNTGITSLFHYLEQALKSIETPLILLRSAEHMQNWTRVIPGALESGMLPSFHHPLDKRFPTVAAQDVGAVSAALLMEPARASGVRVVSVEGPRRISATYVADVLSETSGRDIAARELPREQWTPALKLAGLSDAHARLITDLYDVHNAGKIDVEFGQPERRFGTTELMEVFAPLVAKLRGTRQTAPG